MPFVRGLQKRSQVSIKGRLFESSIGFRGGSTKGVICLRTLEKESSLDLGKVVRGLHSVMYFV